MAEVHLVGVVCGRGISLLLAAGIKAFMRDLVNAGVM